MSIEQKNKLFKKMVKKYGDIIVKDYIQEIVLKGENPYEVEIEICRLYIEELNYNNGEVKYNFNK